MFLVVTLYRTTPNFYNTPTNGAHHYPHTIFLFKIYLTLTCGKCESDNRLDGKTVIVTGANSGIGYEAARELAWRGAKVILGCRNAERAEEARKSIVRGTENENVHVRLIDMTNLTSVRQFAEQILKEETQLDVLINNAGASGLGNKITDDGILIGMQVNHFGPFLLTKLLLPLLEKSAPSRVINVSSYAHYWGKLDFENIDGRKNWNDFRVYCNSKLYNVMTANELNRRVNKKVIANSLHPGVVATKLFESIPNKLILAITEFLLKSFCKTPLEGAQTVIYLAVSEDGGSKGGRYFSDCKERKMLETARDEKLAAKLWKMSEEMVGLSS